MCKCIIYCTCAHYEDPYCFLQKIVLVHLVLRWQWWHNPVTLVLMEGNCSKHVLHRTLSNTARLLWNCWTSWIISESLTERLRKWVLIDGDDSVVSSLSLISSTLRSVCIYSCSLCLCLANLYKVVLLYFTMTLLTLKPY